MGDDALIFLGAEAEVRHARFFGLAAVVKRRLPKAYRRAELDHRIRRERTRSEASLLAEAASAGIPTPRVFDVDLEHATLTLEAIEGDQLRVRLERDDETARPLSRAFGALVGRLHAAGLVHGDLTTSNVMVEAGGLRLLDFGLAQRSTTLEDQGVDLHQVERTYESSHPGRTHLFASFLEGYATTGPQAAAALRRMDDIKSRARYA